MHGTNQCYPHQANSASTRHMNPENSEARSWELGGILQAGFIGGYPLVMSK